MLQILRLSNFQIGFQDFEKNRDYNMRISFRPNLDDPQERNFGFQYGLILYPHTFGTVDTTINDTDYECYILYDDSVPNIPNSPYPYFSFFKRKVEKDIVEISPKEPGKVSQSTAERIGAQFRALKGPTGETGVNVGESSIELVAGDNKIIVSTEGIALYGPISDYNLPMKSTGGVFQQTGIMQIIPDVPPFGQIKYLPNIGFIMKAKSMLSIVEVFQKALSGL